MGWKGKAAKVAGKSTLKKIAAWGGPGALITAVVLVDGMDLASDVATGNLPGAAMTLSFMALDIVSGGYGSDAVKGIADVTQETLKEASKEAAKETLKQGSKEVVKDVVKEGGKQAVRSGLKELPKEALKFIWGGREFIPH